ncbi:hypothetical protein Tco_1026007 [Tanacetum coccineum]
MCHSSCSAVAEKILRGERHWLGPSIRYAKDLEVPFFLETLFRCFGANRGLPRLLDLEDPSEEYPPASSAKGPIWEFSDLSPPDTSLKSLRGAEIRKNTVSSPQVLNPRPSSDVRLQDTSIVEAKLSSRGSMTVAACIRLCLVCPSCLLGAACKSPACIRLCPRGQSYLHAPSTSCGPDVCDIRTSYVSRQCTSSEGDNAAPCLLRRLATPEWLLLAF